MNYMNEYNTLRHKSISKNIGFFFKKNCLKPNSDIE